VVALAAALVPAVTRADTLVVEAREDTFIRDDNPMNNYSVDWALLVGNTASSAAELNVLIRFPLTNDVLSRATIDGVTLRMVKRVSGNSVAGDSTIRVFQTLRPWNVTHATWVNYATGSPWSVGGAEGAGTDHDPTLLASFTGNELALPVGTNLTFTSEAALTTAVRDSLAGTLDVLLMVPDEPNRRIWNLASVEDPTYAAPRLTIQYTPPPLETLILVR